MKPSLLPYYPGCMSSSAFYKVVSWSNYAINWRIAGELLMVEV